MKFNHCLNVLEKRAGFLEGLKDLALTEVSGTKPWVIGRAKKPLTDTLRSAARPAAQSGVRTAVRGAGAGRVYDVSEMARKMGIT